MLVSALALSLSSVHGCAPSSADPLNGAEAPSAADAGNGTANGSCTKDEDCDTVTPVCGRSGHCLAKGHCHDSSDCEGELTCDPATTTCILDGCEQQTPKARAVPPNLLIALDRSCSMQPKSGDSSGGKWAAAVSAVNQLTTGFAAQARWGLALFPDTTGESCAQVDPQVVLADNNEAKIQTLLTSALSTSHPLYPEGPCVTNISDTLAMLAKVDALYDPMRTNRVLLITDGSDANCGNVDTRNNMSVDTLKAMNAKGVSTFVVGFGTATNKASMNRFADAGGVPRNDATNRYYQADDPAALERALGEIAKQVVGCDFSLDSTPTDPSLMRVTLSGKEIARDETHTMGWDYDPEKKRLTLFGATCEALRDAEANALSVVFTCPVL